MLRGSCSRNSRASTFTSNTDSVSCVSTADETLSVSSSDTNKQKQEEQQVTSDTSPTPR